VANERARALRAQPSDAERKLWTVLRNRQLAGHRFRRQAPIGRYIVDFACFERKLVVEVDGGQHATAAQQDAMRTAWLESQGFRVLRFWNHDVLGNIDGVAAAIHRALRETRGE
jgi:adenine-specific DNA-methyltransferase